MESYFRQRDTPIARDGLTALTNTLAGIYYIPFKVTQGPAEPLSAPVHHSV